LSEDLRVLVVDDEVQIRRFLKISLEANGYHVYETATGQEALEKAALLRPELIILDLGLPDMDGLTVLNRLREWTQTPVLILSVLDADRDKIAALDAGADDYLTKPFSMRELMARVKAQMRRSRLLREELSKSSETQKQQEKLKFGNLIINLTRREVMLDDEPLAVKPQEYDLLVFFAEHKGQMLSRGFVLERVWGWDFIGDSRTVDVHVRWLRQKIEEDPGKPKRIVTVRGGGYRFEG